MARQQKEVVEEVPVSASPAKSLFDRVAGYLDANDWNYTAVEDKGYFSMGCKIKDANIRIIVDVAESDDWRRVMVFANFPIFVPEHKRAAVAESISRINYRTPFGNLEMDFADGEVRVKTVVEVAEEVSDTTIGNTLDSSIRTADRYFAPIMAVVFGNVAPEKVLELAEKPTDATIQ